MSIPNLNLIAPVIFETHAFKVCLILFYFLPLIFFLPTYKKCHNLCKPSWIVFKCGWYQEHIIVHLLSQFVYRLVDVVESYRQFSKIVSGLRLRVNYL